jgi:hypothetical protein
MATIQIRERHKEIAIKIALAAGLCAVFFHFIIRPVFSESVFLKQQVQESHARLELFQDVHRLKDELSVAEEPFPVLASRSSMVGKLSDIANKNKIDVQTLTPKTIPEGEYTNLRIELSAQASFFPLMKFLKELEAFEPPLNVSNLSLSQFQRSYSGADEEKDGMLQVHLSLDTYLLKQTRRRTKS